MCGGRGWEWIEKGGLFQRERAVLQLWENAHPLPRPSPEEPAEVWTPETTAPTRSAAHWGARPAHDSVSPL